MLNKVLLGIIIACLIAVTAIGCWQWGHDSGYASGRQAGYSAGYEQGHQTGYDAGKTYGFNTGYAAGKTDGYDTGYSAGYAAGYGEGKSAGYQVGYDVGYDKGYDEGYDKGYDVGYDEGYDEGYQDGQTLANLYDPTYTAMQWFLQQDATGNPVNLNVVYNNPLFADTVRANAENQHIRCFIVLVQFTSGQYHLIVAFKTTDQGTKYVEPQNDHEVTLTVGQSYSQQNGFTLKPNDVIQSFTVFD